MSRENVEIVRESTERFNRDGFLDEEFFHPEIELSNIAESPLPGPYRGYEGLRAWRDGIFDVTKEVRFEIDHVVDVDEDDAVVYGMRLRGRARHTGIEIDIGWTNVNWFKEGRIWRVKAYTDHAEALEAVGLRS